MNLPLFIAKRYLISKKSHNAINIISGISVAGIAFGTMALVIVLSGFNGLSDLVQSLYNSFDADIEITAKQGKTFDPNNSSFQTILKSENLAHYTEVMEGNALLKYDDKQSIAIIKGVSPEFQKMSRFDTLVREGDFNISKNNIVIGKGISYVLQTRPNDFASIISIYAPKRGKINSMNPEDGLNEMKAYAAGVFSINDELDNYIIMDIEKARALLDYTTEVTSIEIAVKKGMDVEKFRKEILQSRLIMVEGKLQIEGEVIHVIVQGCYNFSSLLRTLTPTNNENLPLLTLAYPDEKSVPPGLDKRSQSRETAQEKIFAEARNFR